MDDPGAEFIGKWHGGNCIIIQIKVTVGTNEGGSWFPKKLETLCESKLNGIGNVSGTELLILLAAFFMGKCLTLAGDQRTCGVGNLTWTNTEY